MKVKLLMLSGASVLTLLSQPVQAQTASNSLAASDEPAQRAGDIVVTAQRREQRLQDVPISITAISASSLEKAGVTGTLQLQTLAPSLHIDVAGPVANIYVRGIGTGATDIGSEGSVAVYIDGVYQPNPVANVMEFNGVERIEVLKGPQGTLFGRNATGGVVQLITKDPSSKPEMNFDVGYDNYQTVRASAYLSGGLTENLAANLAVQYDNQNKGWGKNVTTGEKRYYARNFNARGKLLFTPGDATKITLAGNYGDSNRQNIDAQNPPGAVLATGQGYLGRYRTASDTDTEVVGKTYGGSLTATHDFGSLMIRNIAAYQKAKVYEGLDQDVSALPLVRGDFYTGTRMYSEEFHVLAPSSAKFQWLVGAYYFDYVKYNLPVDITGLVFDPAFTNPNAGVAIYGRANARSISGFAQGTYPLTDGLNLTAGIRYTRDKVDYTGSVNVAGTSIVAVSERNKFYKSSKPTWRLSLDYKFSPDILGYVSYNRGVKSGGFSTGVAASTNTPFLAEQLDAYEVGLKTQLFDRKLTLNTAAFHYDYANIQTTRISAGATATINGPSAKLSGFEVEMNARVTPRLTLNANGTYLHSEFGDFLGAPNVPRLPNGRDGAGDPNFNAKGNRLPFTPKFAGNIGFDYRVPLDNGEITLNSNLNYTGKAFTRLDNRLFIKEHVLLSASLGWKGSNGLRLSVWGKNLTNTYYYNYLAAVAGGNDFGIPAAPRTYGVTLGYDF